MKKAIGIVFTAVLMAICCQAAPLIVANQLDVTNAVNGISVINVTNALNKTLSMSGTNVQIDLQGYTTNNTADLGFVLSATTNIWFLPLTNTSGFAGKGFKVEIDNAGLVITEAFNTNNTAGCATWVPPSFGQFLAIPTNTTLCRQFLWVEIGSGGTNAYVNQWNITR